LTRSSIYCILYTRDQEEEVRRMMAKLEYLEGKIECSFCGKELSAGAWLREDGRYLVVLLTSHSCEDVDARECEEVGLFELEELEEMGWEVES
jgi:hypothetical protein